MDAILLLFAVMASRMAFRLIRQILPAAAAQSGRKVLIYGAGDGGEMVLRELNNNPEWSLQPVGFIDDDPLKRDKVIHGLKVYDANGSLAEICHEKEIAEILISIRNLPADRLKTIRAVCDEAEVILKRAHISIETVDLI
jgi:UDP-GlcNAc:undecaprenyl-phosphate GlcNAc-1-phosphate transferase